MGAWAPAPSCSPSVGRRGAVEGQSSVPSRPSKAVSRFCHIRLELRVGSPPRIDHKLVRVSRLLTLGQGLRDAASLQDPEDEECAPATPHPVIQELSCLSSLPP